MRIIKVDKPIGVVRLKKWGRKKSYLCQTERAKLNESFNEWYERTCERVSKHPAYKDVVAMALYDITSHPLNEKDSGLFIRYGWVRKHGRVNVNGGESIWEKTKKLL
jgi:hypothetical protein